MTLWCDVSSFAGESDRADDGAASAGFDVDDDLLLVLEDLDRFLVDLERDFFGLSLLLRLLAARRFELERLLDRFLFGFVVFVGRGGELLTGLPAFSPFTVPSAVLALDVGCSCFAAFSLTGVAPGPSLHKHFLGHM